eukprot:14347-Heterococcus_DN1.PRE.7
MVLSTFQHYCNHTAAACHQTHAAVMCNKFRKLTQEQKSVFDPYRLQLEGCDTRSLSAYANGGVLTQVKVPVTRAHRSLQENLTHPVSVLNTYAAACTYQRA